MSADPERDLVVYGPFHSTFFDILKSFRRKYPEYDINLTYFAAHPTPVFERIQKEIELGLPTADVVMLPHYATLFLKSKGFLTEYFSDENSVYPDMFKDRDGLWSAIAVEPTEAVYNPRVIDSREVPTSLDDLINSELEGKVAVQSVMDRSEGMFSFYYFAKLYSVLGEKKWWQIMRGLVDSVKPRSFPCYHNLQKYVARGDYGIGFPLPVIKIGWSVNTLTLRDLPPISSLRSIALLANGSHPIAAKLFYDFLLSEDWQRSLGKSVEGLLPARPGVRMKYGDEYTGKGVVYFPNQNDVDNAFEFLQSFKDIHFP